MCPWPLLISYLIYILIHSFLCVLFHWCFSGDWRKGHYNLLSVHSPFHHFVIHSLFCHCCALLFSAFFPWFCSSFSYLLSTLHSSLLSTFPFLVFLQAPYKLHSYPVLFYILFLTRVFFSHLAEELNFAGKDCQRAAASPVSLCCDGYPRWGCFGLH